MFRSFSARNFRCFRDTTIEGLGAVNLFVGKNNVGKTALLEAVFLHIGSHNPELPGHLNLLRGMPPSEFTAEEMWGWLFWQQRISEPVELRTRDDEGKERLLRICLGTPETTPVPAPGNGQPGPARPAGAKTTALGARDLRLERYEGSTPLAASRATIVTEGPVPQLRIEPAQGLTLPLGIYLAASAHQLGENIERFSKLQEMREDKAVLEALQILEPRLKRLVLSVKGGGATIQGEIGLGRLIPLPLMGDGMGRLLSYVLAIAAAPKGTVLIDEMENGLHYSVLRDVWKVVADFARHSQTQVFATTHSGECIRAAHEAFRNTGPQDFCLHKLERVGDCIEAVRFTQEMLSTANATGLEVR